MKVIIFFVGVLTNEGKPASFWSCLNEVQEGLQVIVLDYKNYISAFLLCFIAYTSLFKIAYSTTHLSCSCRS